MNKSETIGKLAVSLVKAQASMGRAIKDSNNPFFKSKYADLTEVIETVKKPLNDNGITFLQIVEVDEQGRQVVETTLLHESGEFISGKTLVVTAKQNDPQALGSAITYAKRYGLQAICGLPTDDDDGEAAMARKQKVQSESVTQLDALKMMVQELKKTPSQIQKMLEWVGSKSTSLDGLTEDEASKLIAALRGKVWAHIKKN
jgi:hypothetical protein